MKTVTLTELKNNFSKFMDLVKRGRTSLLVYERDVPIIRIVYASDDSADGREIGDTPAVLDIAAQRLTRAGLIRPASQRPSAAAVRQLRVTAEDPSADIVATLLEERENDR